MPWAIGIYMGVFFHIGVKFEVARFDYNGQFPGRLEIVKRATSGLHVFYLYAYSFLFIYIRDAKPCRILKLNLL